MKNRIKFLVCGCALAAATGFAATVTTNAESVVTIDVAAGETYVYPETLSSAVSGVVKTGAGTVKFSTAVPSFAGPFTVSAGFVDFTVRNAYGTGAITVADGAGMIVSHDSAGQQVVQIPGLITISGAGPDGKGALRYTGSGMGDEMFKSVKLAADATYGGNRSGVANLDFNHHVLTWVGGNMMALDAKWTNIGGFVHRGTADMCFQVISFDASAANAPFTIATNTAYITTWNCSTKIPFALKVEANTRMRANWGSSRAYNVWSGPISVSEGKTLQLETRGSDTPLRITGKISGAGVVKGGDGTIYLDNAANDWTGGFQLKAGTTYVPVPGALPGYDVAGRVTLAGNNYDTDASLVTVVGSPISGLAVQDTWTAENLTTLFANIGSTGQRQSNIGIYTGAGVDFTYAGTVTTNCTKFGTGTLRLTGEIKNNSFLRGRGGLLRLEGTAERAVGCLYTTPYGTTELADGTLRVTSMIRCANGWRNGFRQTGGTFDQTSGDFYLAENESTYGFWELIGGSQMLNATVVMAAKTNAYSAFVQRGGTFGTHSGLIELSQQGDALYYVGGGTNDTTHSAGGTESIRVGTGSKGSAVVAVTGTNSVLQAGSLVLGASDSSRTNVLTVTDGGALKLDRFYVASYSEARFSNVCSIVSVDGGAVYPRFGWGWNHQGGSIHRRNVQHWVIQKGGMVLDTSECKGTNRSGAAPHDFPDHLEPATGSGFDAIYLPTNNANFKEEAYIGPTRVRITDATGWGATAFADFDAASGKLTGVKVLSRGCDYSAVPRVRVDSADGTKTYDCTYVLSANVSGGLTKRGTNNAALWDTNTYTGVTCVEQGLLNMAIAEAMPTNSPVRVLSGATLQITGARRIRSAGGSGTLTGGAVTLTEGVVAYSDALNAKQGLSVNNALTFAEGAMVTADDPATIASGTSKWPLVTATSAIVGTPTLDRTTLPAPYDLTFSDDRKTLYLVCPRGTTLILR